MAASDTDFFEIKYYASTSGLARVEFFYKNYFIIGGGDQHIFAANGLVRSRPPFIKINILDKQYDTVTVLPIIDKDTVFMKPKIGIIKLVTSKYTYELIK